VAPDDSESPDERRHSPRAAAGDLQVGLRFESVQQFLSAYAGDISEGGMFVHMENARHEVGQTVALRFEAGKERIVQGTARIVRVDATGIGLQFVELDDNSRRLIEMIVRIKLAAG
jgi:c-di-GMP-binding flagellar brake protein YcgR